MSLFNLSAVLGLDSSEYERGLDEAENKANSFGNKLKSALGTAAKVTTAAVGAAAAGVTALTKAAVDSFSSYEQLKGGIETLFGDSAERVMRDASNAYKTAGMDANTYMETSIQAAAALINSLEGDTETAAELMNMSIIDMSDNVNKMGTTMEAVQNAYRGFSRGNFTMLDNLALGYAGTKESMKELLDRANEINAAHGIMSEYAIDSYSDIVQAIHVVQQEMGITGTTAKEAEGTITGSFASLRAGWKNLVTALASGEGDIDKLINDLAQGIELALGNILPAIERSLVGIGDLIKKLAPVIGEKLPELFANIAPSLVSAAVSMTNAFVQALIDNLPQIVDSAAKIFETIGKSLANNAPVLFNSLKRTLPKLIKTGLSIVKDLAKEIWSGIKAVLSDSMPELANAVIPIVDNVIGVVKNLFNFISENGDTVIKIVKGLVAAFLTFKVASLINSATTALSGLLSMMNPVTLLVGAVAALVGVFVALNDQSIKLSEEDQERIAEAKEMAAKANDAAQAWDNLKEAQKKYIGEALSEQQYYENLWEELKKITDENGKIQEGYEARAKYITEKLGSVYGTEIEIVDGVIQKYGELQTTIADLMQQRRAEIILKGQEQLWQNAVENQQKYGEEFANAKAKYEEAQKELAKTDARWYEVQAALNKGTSDKSREAFDALRKESKELVSQRASWLEQYGNAASAMKKYDELLNEGLYYITNYEKNMELMQEGHYDEITTLQWDYLKDVKDLDEAQKQQLQAKYNAEIELYKRAKEMMEKYQDESYQSQANAHLRQAGILEEQLKELDIYVNEVSKLYNTLSETLGADNMFLSPKGAAVDRLLSSGKPITAQTIEQEMLTDKGSGVTINVYGAEGQDVSELAEIVSQKIAKNTRQERMAW